MNRDVESGLRAALTRREPPPGFSERVMRQLEVRSAGRWRLDWRPALLAPLAALLLLATAFWMNVRSERATAEADGRRVIYALKLTSRKLAAVNRRLEKSGQERVSIKEQL